MALKDPAHVLDEIAKAQVPQDLNLLPGILAKIQPGTLTPVKPPVSPGSRRRLAALLVALVLLIAIFSLPGVASALKTLVGYIPGVGTVEQDAPLRVLAQPFTETRDGFTLTVESALLDPTRTVLQYRLTGPFPTWEDPTRRPVLCQDPPVLRLANGQEMAYPAREGSFGGGQSSWKDIFPAVPAAENRATLVLPCLSELPAGDGPQNWEIPLTFVPAPPDLAVYPVLDLPTPQPAATEETAAVGGMQFTLQGMAALEDGYYLQTWLSWDKDPAIYEVQVYPDSIHLFDADGQEVPVWSADPNPPMAPAGNLTLALNLQTGPVLTPGPARLVVDYVGMSMPAAARFTLDVGASPQPGQTWEVNQDLEINGNRLQVLSAEYIQAGPGEPAMLMLYLASDSGILTIIAMDTEHEILGTGGSPGSAQVPFRAGWYYKDGFPTGIITVDITTITLRRPGPWSIAWTPPAAAAAPTVTAPARLPQSGSQSGSGSGLCPDAAPVPAAFQDLPAGLAGRVAFSEGENHDLFAANLDGSRRIPLGPGLFPDLSLDGRRVVYRGLEGELHVRDLAGGEDRLIPETGQEGIIDLRPRWSPDGQQIAFDRVTGHASDIYRVSSDGSNLQALLNGPEDESFLGWAADGRRLFYRVSVAEGQSIRLLDLDTGRSMETALLPFEAAQVSLSPDGQRIAYIDDLGISLVPLGEAPVFLLSNPLEFGNPLWSPDGRWIALTYWPSQDYGERRLALLQPDTCQLLQLDQQMGDWLSSWVP